MITAINLDHLDIESRSIADLRKGYLLELIPELEPLQSLVETNNWHNSITTWNHTWDVMEYLRQTFARSQFHVVLNHFLNTRIDNLSLRELLSWAIVVHDIAKPECLVSENGKTKFPGHEMKGSITAIEIFNRLGFTTFQVDWIANLVRYHGKTHEFFGVEAKSEFEQRYSLFARMHPWNTTAILLHSLADSINSYEQATDPEAYTRRIRRYEEILTAGW